VEAATMHSNFSRPRLLCKFANRRGFFYHSVGLDNICRAKLMSRIAASLLPWHF